VELLTGPVLLITNPAARRAARALNAALAAFRAAGVPCDALATEWPGHAAELAAAHGARYRAVFTLGGDGTAMEVVGALAHSGIPVGILPGGTGNLVARSLGIPLDVRRAVPRLLEGVDRPAVIDLGILDSGRRFAFSAGVGVDARMIAETPAAAKRRFGVAAYALTAARAALERRPFTVRASVDDGVVERSAAAVMIVNVGSVLNDLIFLGPGIRADDGLLDLCLFSPASTGDTMAIAWRMFRKHFGTERGGLMTYRPGRTFRVECDPPQLYQADGEVLGTTPFEARVDPAAATVLLPGSRD
jgi:YegS/Rv2252/BmrU family lipid kinase